MTIELSRFLIQILLCLASTMSAAGAIAQVPFPPDVLVKATSQQMALTVLGAGQAEQSGHLLLEAPDIALPGKLKVQGSSLLPGTSQIVLLRVTKPLGANPIVPEKPYVAGARVSPGTPAKVESEIDAVSTLDLILLAQSRGKWFFAMRQVKVGKPATGVH